MAIALTSQATLAGDANPISAGAAASTLSTLAMAGITPLHRHQLDAVQGKGTATLTIVVAGSTDGVVAALLHSDGQGSGIFRTPGNFTRSDGLVAIQTNPSQPRESHP